MMTGNIQIKTATETQVAFNGNQTIKKQVPLKSPPKWYVDK